tara:strand:+ start:439 stop:639 length:201 start_codon:yes stop_codon:yes gene_type:complete
MVANIEDPPYDIIGSGEPTIGNKPRTIHMFTDIYIKIADAKPKQKSLPKKLLDKNPILTILNIITA